jgi:ADP-ribosyl-[dinitrogen reductase] hydrolase
LTYGTASSLDAIADGFLRWYADRPPDIGNQTRHVLARTAPGPGSGARMTEIAQHLHKQTHHTAGNGSLMRTGPVALAHLGDTAAIVDGARLISALTHADPMTGDACALWCLAIDAAVRTGQLDIRAGLPSVDSSWAALIDEAERGAPASFANNGWVVAALQASWSALRNTSSLQTALVEAVRAGGDTDTVAAITGSLAGACYGASAVPFAWRRRLHGWPGLRGRDLIHLAVLTARGGMDDPQGWPRCQQLASYSGASTTTVPHPDDPGVVLGSVGAMQPGVADAVVSLCRLGSTQVPLAGVAPEDHAEAWVVDEDDANNDLPLAIRDAADAVHQLRAEGKTVLLHCVHAQTRTPVVAAAYGAQLTGSTTGEALARVIAALPGAHPRPSIRRALDLDTTPGAPLADRRPL